MEKKVKARVHHQCSHCDRLIKKGEIYIYDEWREPVYADVAGSMDVTQCGIWYRKLYLCLECDYKLSHDEAMK